MTLSHNQPQIRSQKRGRCILQRSVVRSLGSEVEWLGFIASKPPRQPKKQQITLRIKGDMQVPNWTLHPAAGPPQRDGSAKKTFADVLARCHGKCLKTCAIARTFLIEGHVFYQKLAGCSFCTCLLQRGEGVHPRGMPLRCVPDLNHDPSLGKPSSR